MATSTTLTSEQTAIAAAVKAEIYSESSQISALPKASTLDGVQSLPAVKGDEVVSVPLALLKGDTGPRGTQGPKGDKGEAFTYADLTGAQKEALFASLDTRYDARYHEERMFRKLWAQVGGSYSAENKYTMATVSGITYEQALKMFAKTNIRANANVSYAIRGIVNLPCNIPLTNTYGLMNFDMFAFDSGFVTIHVSSVSSADSFSVSSLNRAFQRCSQLKNIVGVLSVDSVTGFASTFTGCPRLEEVWLRNLKCSVSFADCPKLNRTTLEYLVANANAEATKTVTVHSKVFAKLTGDTSDADVAAMSGTEIAAWGKIVTDGQAKKIAFASA